MDFLNFPSFDKGVQYEAEKVLVPYGDRNLVGILQGNPLWVPLVITASNVAPPIAGSGKLSLASSVSSFNLLVKFEHFSLVNPLPCTLRKLKKSLLKAESKIKSHYNP